MSFLCIWTRELAGSASKLSVALVALLAITICLRLLTICVPYKLTGLLTAGKNKNCLNYGVAVVMDKTLAQT